MDVAHPAKSVDHHAGRDAGGLKAQRQIGRIPRNGEGQPALAGEGAENLIVVLRLAGDRDDLHLILVTGIGLLHEGELHLARPAPAGPDIQEHHVLFFQRFGKGNAPTVIGRHGKIIHLTAQGIIHAAFRRGRQACQAKEQRRQEHHHTLHTAVPPFIISVIFMINCRLTFVNILTIMLQIGPISDTFPLNGYILPKGICEFPVNPLFTTGIL